MEIVNEEKEVFIIYFNQSVRDAVAKIIFTLDSGSKAMETQWLHQVSALDSSELTL